MTLPLFHRSPRTPPRFPAGEVEIQAPPARPSPPTLSAATVILPIVVTAVTLGLSVAFVATQPTYLLISLPMMLISGLMGLINYNAERGKYRRAVAERERVYRQYLAQRRQEVVRALCGWSLPYL